MITSIDDKRVSLRSSKSRDREDLLREVKEILSNEGKVLRFIEADGVAIEEEAFKALREIVMVNFISISVQELVMESLENSEKHLITIIDTMDKSACALEKKQADDAMTALIDAVEGICWQLETIYQLQILLSVEERERMDEEFEAHREALIDGLERTSEFMKERKHAEAAGIIREKINPSLDGLHSYIENLRSLAHGKAW